ncbi:MAG: hypothetical protein ACFCVK_24730 [Acidimicrobiales bacterium]
MMLGDTDLFNRYEVERLQRSVAMLGPGAPTFDREEALQLLATVRRLIERCPPP